MRRLFLTLLLVLAVIGFTFTRPALAGDAANGAKLFSANCAACHMGGGNVVVGNKTLKQEALKNYGMDSLEAIVNQVTNGKNDLRLSPSGKRMVIIALLPL
jgi:cytochrome c6